MAIARRFRCHWCQHEISVQYALPPVCTNVACHRIARWVSVDAVDPNGYTSWDRRLLKVLRIAQE